MSVICETCEAEYVFLVKYGSVTTVVNPLNFLETMLVDELELNQIFYRRKFQGSLIFGGRGNKADFNYFWGFESTDPCADLDFMIYRNGVIWWQGYFSTSNGSWDMDACTFEITPLVNDIYTTFLNGADIEYNILAAAELPEVIVTYDNGIDTPTTYNYNRMFYDTIEYLAQQLIPTIDISSTFFESATNPVLDPGTSTNRYAYLTIAQKSDIKRPTASNHATVGLMSFNQIMEICRSMNLYWDLIDVAGVTTLQIEHVSFWPEDAGIDIRTQKIARGTNKYKYITEDMPKYELFSWMEAGDADFIGYPIWYNSSCVNQDPNSNSVKYSFTNITTDLQYIIDSVADADTEPIISDDGWVILANELRGADLYVWWNLNSTDTALVANIDMSWYYLHKCFWMHGRQLISGYMNGNNTTFYTARKVKRQECSIVYCDVFDPAEFLTTELGETYFGGEKAKVERAAIRPYGQIDLSLLYGPEDNANPGYTYSKIMFATEVRTDDSWVYGSTWYGLLSEPAPIGGLTFQFKMDIKDGIGGDCLSGTIDLVFAAGEYYATSLETAWCDPGGGPDYTIQAITQATIPAGWSARFEISDESSGV